MHYNKSTINRAFIFAFMSNRKMKTKKGERKMKKTKKNIKDQVDDLYGERLGEME